MAKQISREGLGTTHDCFYAWTDLPTGDHIHLYSGSAIETVLDASLPETITALAIHTVEQRGCVSTGERLVKTKSD